MLDRRHLIKGAGTGILALGSATAFGSFRALALDTVTLPFENGERPLVKYPQKRPLIELTSRPPQLETPFSVFDEGAITPNDAFFVRYHLAGIPLNIDPDTFRCRDQGQGRQSVKLSLEDSSSSTPWRLVAVNQCSGNSRGFVHPRVAGGQLGQRRDGQRALERRVAEGRARSRPACSDGAQSGRFQRPGRAPISDKTPDFVKALDIDHARDGEVMLAYAMNGRGPAGTQRLSAAARGARLLRHLLGQAPPRDHRHGRDVRRFLDEDGLSHSRQRLRLRGTGHDADSNGSDQPPQCSLLHHQPH